MGTRYTKLSSTCAQDDILARVSSWDDLKTVLAGLTDIEKGRLFERLTQLYLRHAPMYRSQLRHVWLLDEVPAALVKELSLPESDKGIDLVAETFDGAYWAIQCKYRENESESITWDELSTFVGLAFGVCRKISFGLVSSSTEHVTKVLYNQPKIGFISVDTWRHLDEEFFQGIRNARADTEVKLVAAVPRPHQQRALEKGLTYFVQRGKSRGKLIAPCGSGKSLTAFWLAQSLKSQSTLVVVPNLALVKQTINVWLKELVAHGERPNWRCVCSDESAGEVDNDDLVTFTHDLGIPCSTDVGEVTQWLKENRNTRRVLFTTYQSGKVVSAAARMAEAKFDLAILDEAHKTAGRADRLFAHFLFDEHVKISRRIFMTATERRYRGYSNEIVSMDDTTIYGETFELLSFKEALSSTPPILSDYEVIFIGVKHAEIEELIRKNFFVRPDQGEWEDVTAQTLANLIALRKAMRSQELAINHAVSFHSSIARAKDFKALQDTCSNALPEFGELSAYHVSGRMTTAARDSTLGQFLETAPSLVTNARCLTEGVDLPKIDCVLFADPKQSTVDIVQAAGRAMRLSEGKSKGFIIVPILITTEEEDQAIEASAFKSVIMILRALSSNDERIIEYFKASSTGNKAKESPVRFLTDEIEPTDIATDAFVKSIELRCWSKLAGLNWRSFKEARDFVHSLGLNSSDEWRTYSRSGDLPDDIPSNPDKTYRNQGWISMGDWLGTGRIASRLMQYCSFEEARTFVRSLRLNSREDWSDYCKSGRKPEDIPASPDKTYKSKGWVSIGDWLGTGSIAPRLMEYRSFEEAREFVRSLQLKNTSEWNAYCESGQKPKDIPSTPRQAYKSAGWLSMGDWLGTERAGLRWKEYRSFEEARRFVQSLQLESQEEWANYCKSGSKPGDIPRDPREAYKGRGWVNLGDWFGTGRIATHEMEYRSFEDAREFVRSLRLKSWKEWVDYYSSGDKPADIPASPRHVYRDKGWVGNGDWLGTGRVAPGQRQYRSFNEAREFARSLKLRSRTEWEAYRSSDSKPDDIPADPRQTYKERGWSGWGDWLGTGTVAPQFKKYRPFEDARAFVHLLRFKSGSAWRTYCASGSKPTDIPSNPDKTYRSQGWISMSDWLGPKPATPRVMKYRSFEEARSFVRSLRLKSEGEWLDYCKLGYKPKNIPANPRVIYKDYGWMSIGDWLGTETVATRLMSYRLFEEAREFVRALTLNSQPEWTAYCKSGYKPKDIPADPRAIYKDSGWVGIGDWLGTGTVAPRLMTYRPFHEAREFVRSLTLTSRAEWSEYCKSDRKPEDIPASPWRVYKNDGWIGMGDWLGTGTVAPRLMIYRPFHEAREFVRSLRLKSKGEWSEYCKSDRKPEDIPASPWRVYKDDGWVSVGDWIGTGSVAPRWMTYRPFEKAREFARSLKLKSWAEWLEYCKSSHMPKDIPFYPSQTYRRQGWIGIADWLNRGKISRQRIKFRSFAEALDFAQSLGLKSKNEWENFCKSGRKPQDIPANPPQTYKNNGWTRWGDWLGTRKMAP